MNLKSIFLKHRYLACIEITEATFLTHVKNIHVEIIMSQIFYSGRIFAQTSFSSLHKTKIRTEFTI